MSAAGLEIGMPRLSDSMEEGTILQWLVDDGQPVARGQDLVEIETDKATMIYQAEADGYLTILVEAGETIPLGEPIARLSQSSTNRPATRGSHAVTSAARNGVSRRTGPSDAKATPVARRMAAANAVSLEHMRGSGPNGRIVKADVQAALVQTAPEAPSDAPRVERGPVTAARPPAEESARLHATIAERITGAEVGFAEDLSRLQQTIARRMTESKATIPDFALTVEVDMEAAVALRDHVKHAAAADGLVAPSFNDLVVKASALALRDSPRANGSFRDGRFELHDRVNVGVAVAVHDGLLVPTIVDADRRTLGDIAQTTRELAARARSGELTPPELSGGTFTVSNLGMYGITRFQAIVNPPQAAILAVGAIERRAVVHETRIVPRRSLTLTLTADHRILYGADAAGFLARIRDLLENPHALLL